MTGLFRSCIILLVLSGWFFTPPTAHGQSSPPPAHDHFETGKRLYEEGLFLQAANYFNKALQSGQERHFTEDARFYLAKSQAALDTLNHRVYTEQFLQDYPAGRYAARVLEDMGSRSFEMQEFEEALSDYARAYKIETGKDERARFLFLMAESTREMAATDSASVLYDTLAHMYPETDWAPKALYSRGRLYLEKEDFDQSSAVFESLRERYPNHAVTRQIGTALGEMYYRQERYEEAIEALRSEMSYLEGEAQMKAVLLIAESHNYLENFDRAATFYRRYINLADEEMEERPAHYGLGWVYHKQQVYHWAAESFGKASKGGDELARKARYYQAVNYKLSGRYDRALEVFETFGDRYTEGFWVEYAYYEWALTAFELGRYDLAIDVLQRLTRGDDDLEDFGKVYSLLGEAYFANNEFTRAVRAFEIAEQTDEVDADMKRQARFQRAWVLYENHAFSEAARAFEEVYRDQPSGELAAEALFWSADSYYNLSQWQQAARQFERFLEGYPGHRFAGAASYSLGWANFHLRNFLQAVRYFEAFKRDHKPPPMALFPYEVDTRLRIGDSYYALGRYDDAIANYDHVAGSEEGGDYALFQMGNSYFRNDQSFEAVRTFRRLPRVFPESNLREQARYNIGYIFFLNGNYDQAIEEFHELINRYPGTGWAARAQYQIGDAFYNAGQFEEAVEAYRTVLDEYPQSGLVVDAVNGIQFAQLAGGKEDTSLDILEDFLNQHPQTGTADQLRFRQAENLLQAGDYEQAISSFRHYIRVTTSESMIPEAWYNIGDACEKLREYSEAVAAYRTIVDEYPESDRVDPSLLNIGRIEYEQERYSDAISALEKLVEREGRLQVEAFATLGDAYFADGRTGRAESAYRRATDIRDDHQQSLIGKGRVALERGQYMDASQLFSRVAELSTANRGAEAQYYLGKVEQARNNHEEAIDEFARVSALYEAYDEWVARAMLATADSYREMGRTGRASQTLQDVIERFPDTKYARQASEQL